MSDYLTDEEQIARLKSWWDENGKSLVISLVVVVAGVIGYRWYEGYRSDQNIAASDLYERFLGSEGEAQDAAIAALSEQAGGTSYEALALLRLAKVSITEGDYAGAQDQLSAAVEAAETVRVMTFAGLFDYQKPGWNRILEEFHKQNPDITIEVVAVPYGAEQGAGGAAVGDDTLGVLGVIGPQRMDYGRVLPLVHYCSELVTRKLLA